MAAPDLSILSPDFSTTVLAVLGVASALMLVYVIRKASSLILYSVRGSGSGHYEGYYDHNDKSGYWELWKDGKKISDGTGRSPFERS